MYRHPVWMSCRNLPVDAKKPKLNKLNSAEWKKTKSRVRGAVQEIARELVLLYAKRQEMKGYQFSRYSLAARI